MRGSADQAIDPDVFPSIQGMLALLVDQNSGEDFGQAIVGFSCPLYKKLSAKLE